MEEDGDIRTVAVGLKTVVVDEAHRRRIEDMVQRVHRITIDATELVSLHITRCLEEGVSLPFIDANFYKTAMMEVSEGKGERKNIDPELEATRKAHMAKLVKVDRSKLDQVLMAQSISLSACFTTNLHLHFRKRVGKYVRIIRFQEFESKEERRLHKLTNLKIASDICKPFNRSFESDVEHHEIVRHLRSLLGCQCFTTHSMESNATKHQSDMLRALYLINKELERKGAKCFSLCPIRRCLSPKFISIDTKAIKSVLGVSGTDHEKKLSRQRALETKKKKERHAYRKTIGLPVIPRTFIAKENSKKFNAPMYHDHVKCIQRTWKSKRSRLHLFQIVRENSWAIPRIESHVRKFLKELNSRKKLQEQSQKESLARMKDEVWKDILIIPRNIEKSMRGRKFSGSIRTDGVSVRLCFSSLSLSSKKRKRSKTTSDALLPVDLPKRGIYAIDQLKHLSRQSYQLIGADPGKKELLVCVDEDAPEFVNAKGTRKPTVRYTAAQRRSETLEHEHKAEREKHLPELLKRSMVELCDTNSRSSTLSTLSRYFQKRREMLPDALKYYESNWLRLRSWKRFRLTQKSLTDFTSRIRSLQRDKSIPIAIAYGSWANIAGKPGAHCNKGAPPCIGKGLRSKLSKHFCIVVTPEQYTSKTCSLCCSVCDSCRDVDAWHRERMLESLKEKGCNDSNCIRKAMRFSVRGLRRCQNNACAAYLNRDYNASVNIQRRCSSLLKGDGVAVRQLNMLEDEVDKQLTAFEQEMQSGD